MNPANRDRFLTARWNNALAAGLGLPMVAFGIYALSTAVLTDKAAFIGLVVFGAVY